MEKEEAQLNSVLKQKILQIFSDFMTRVTKVEELVAAGSSLLVGFRHGLEVNTCQLGLQNNLSKARCFVNELEGLVHDLRGVLETASESLPHSQHKDIGEEFDPLATTNKEEMVSSDLQNPEVTDYAAMVAIIYSMVKQDYMMQEKIVSSLNLKTSSGELECYCLMWSLRPFIKEEIMHQAWRLIP